MKLTMKMPKILKLGHLKQNQLIFQYELLLKLIPIYFK